MSEAERHVLISNAGIEPLTVWIEPWCDELVLSPKSWLSFEAIAENRIETAPPSLEMNEDTLVIWAGGSGTAIVTIDGAEQDTASKIVGLPQDLFDMPVKSFVNTVFGNFPEARPGGSRPKQKQTLWSRLVAKWR